MNIDHDVAVERLRAKLEKLCSDYAAAVAAIGLLFLPADPPVFARFADVLGAELTDSWLTGLRTEA